MAFFAIPGSYAVQEGRNWKQEGRETEERSKDRDLRFEV